MPTQVTGTVRHIRETLVAAHISAVAVAVLVFFSLDYAVRALAEPFPSVVTFVATAVAIGGMPYMPHRTSLADQFLLIPTSFDLFLATANLAAAWLLSRWAHGAGPLSYLKQYGPLLARRKHA